LKRSDAIAGEEAEMDDDKSISLEELLAKRARRRNLAVVEAIEGDDQNVTLTPWSAHSGCLCHLAMRVPKRAIKGIVTTEETHECCGKTLNVVDALFSETESITVKDLFEQLSTSAASYARHRAARGAHRRGGRTRFFRRIGGDIAGAHWEGGKRSCRIRDGMTSTVIFLGSGHGASSRSSMSI
jgi:hypothetical protein